METLLKIWNFLNGKKTVIAAVLMTTGVIIRQWIIGVNGYDPAWIETVLKNVDYLGGFFGAVGLTHKAAKGMESTK